MTIKSLGKRRTLVRGIAALFVGGGMLTSLATPSAYAQRYWDSNNATAGFGTAQGTWAAPTTGSATQNWSANSGGTAAFANYTTLITDALNFGTDSAGLGGGTITVSGTVQAASLRFGSSTTGNITLSGGTINLAAATSIHVGAGGNTVHTISSSITGAGTSLTKTGNILALSGANNYAGATNITAGTLVYRNTGAKSASSTHTFSAGTTIGLGVATTGSFFTTTDIDNAFSGTATGNLSNVVFNATNNVGIDTTAGNFTYATSVLGSPTRGLTKLGANILTLTGANTHTGATTISGGTLRLENTLAVQNSSSLAISSNRLELGTDTAFSTSPNITMQAGTIVSDRASAGAGLTHVLGTAQIGNGINNFIAGANVTSGTAVIQLAGMTNDNGSVATPTLNPTTANLIITGGVTLGVVNTGTANFTLDGTGSVNSIGGAIVNGTRATANLIKSGTSTWSLSGDSTYNGGTTINAGTLDLGGGTSNGSLASPTLTLAGGTFAYTRTGTNTQSFTTTNINSSTGAISVAAGNTLNLGTVTRPTGVGFDFSTTGAGVVAALAANNVGGIMPGFSFGNTWAVANGADMAITGLSSYTLTSVAGTAAANYTANNIDVDNSAGTLDGAITANSLRFSTPAANTLTLTGTPNVITSGGVLVGSGVGANLSTITGGELAGAASKDLAVIQNNTLGGLTISSVIVNNTGATGLTKSGAGVLTLAGANTYNGVTAVTAGTLRLSGTGTLGAPGSSVAVSSGALLDLNGTNQNVTLVAGNGVGTVANNSGSGTSLLTLAGTATINGSFVTIVDNTTTPGGKVGVVITANTQPLSNLNTYSGGTTVNGGAFLYLLSTTPNGAGTGPINLTAANSGLVVDSVTYANDITGAGYIHSNSATSNNVTFTGNLTNTGPYIWRGGAVGNNSFNFAGNGTTSVLSGVIGSTTSLVNGAVATGNVIKSGTGTLTLSGANVYTGGTTVSAGILNLSGPRTAASGAFLVGNLLSTTATLNISNGTFTTGNFSVGSGDNPLTAGIVNQTGGTLTMSANQLLLGNGGTGTTPGSNSTGTYNLSGGTLNTIAGTLGVTIGVNTGATGVFNLSGTGTLAMPATSTMQIARSDGNPAPNTTGTFNQTGGTATVGILRMGGSGATTGAGGNATLSLTGGTFSAVTFGSLSVGDGSTSAINIGGNAQVTLPAFPTVRGAGATATITFDSGATGFLSPTAASATYMPAGTFTNAYLTANGAKLNVGTGNDITIGQVLADAVSPAAAGTLTKTGSGVLTLTGVNTYTGATNVNAGTLIVGVGGVGSLGATTTTVASGARLGGSGSIGGSVTIQTGGILSPGNSPGNLTVGATTVAQGSIYEWEINNAVGTAGSQWDLTTLTGALDLSSLTNVSAATKHTINLLSLTGGNVLGDLTGFSNSTNYTWKLYDSNTAISSFAGDLFNIDATNFKYGGSLSPSGSFSIVLGTDPSVTGGDNTELYVRYAAATGGLNNSQILITSTPTTSIPATGVSTKDIVLGNVFVGGASTTGTETITKTGGDATTYSVATSGDVASTTFVNGSATASGTITLANSTSGSKSGTVTIDNLATDSFGGGLGSADGNDVFTVTQNVFQTASLTGAATGGNLNLTNAASTDGGQRAGITITGITLSNAASDNRRASNFATPTLAGGGVVGTATVGNVTATVGTYSLKSDRLNNATVSYRATATAVGDYTDAALAGLADPTIPTMAIIATQTGALSTPDRTGTVNVYGSARLADIAMGDTLAGYSSTVAAAAASGPDRKVLGTTATILAGTATTDMSVSMAWRVRGANESSSIPANNDAGTLPNGYLISDVVNLSGVTGTYVLQMNYDESLLGVDASSSAKHEIDGVTFQRISLAWNDNGTWTNAVNGNTGGTNQFVLRGYQLGDEAVLGLWGVDTVNNVAWAVLNHNSEFAVIPEPSTLVLGGLALLGFAGVGLRRRRLAK